MTNIYYLNIYSVIKVYESLPFFNINIKKKKCEIGGHT